MMTPEKIYVDNPNHDFWYRTKNSNSIEYIRTDAFIDKAEKWLHGFMECSPLFEYQVSESEQKETIEDFRIYMKGE